MTNARQQAEKDIRQDLKQKGLTFIPYLKFLNPIMRELSRQHIAAQKNLVSKHLKH